MRSGKEVWLTFWRFSILDPSSCERTGLAWALWQWLRIGKRQRAERVHESSLVSVRTVWQHIFTSRGDFRYRVAGFHGGGRRRERRSSDQKWKWGRSGATVGGGDVARRMPRMSGEMAGSGADGSLTRKLSAICIVTDAGLDSSEETLAR